MTHTPGPWEAAGASVIVGRELVAMCDTINAPWATQEANARLIAAAPDLLAACKNVEAIIPGNYQRALAHLQAAIAKAEGKS